MIKEITNIILVKHFWYSPKEGILKTFLTAL